MVLRDELQRAGMAWDGGGGAPALTGEWARPATVELVGTELRWSGWSDERARLEPNTLERFLNLRRRGDEELATFAATHGMLHPPGARAVGRGVQVSPGDGSERVDLWRAVASDLATMLAISARVHQGQRATADLWLSLQTVRAELREYGHGKPIVNLDAGAMRLGGRSLGGRSLGVRSVWGLPSIPAMLTERAAVGWIMSMWLNSSAVRVDLAWRSDSAPALMLSAPGLISCLVLQTSQLVAGATGIALCRECGSPFPLRHRNRRYCDACRDLRAPQRAAEAAYRARRGGQGELLPEG